MFTNETIPDSPLFAGFDPEEKESILKCLSAVEKKYEKGDADQQQKCGQRKGQGPNQISFRIHTVFFHFVLLPADIGP